MFAITASVSRAIGIFALILSVIFLVPVIFIAGIGLVMVFSAAIAACRPHVLQRKVFTRIQPSARSGKGKQRGEIIDTTWERVD